MIFIIGGAIREAKQLCTDKRYWQKWHDNALMGLGRLGYDEAAIKLVRWLGEIK